MGLDSNRSALDKHSETTQLAYSQELVSVYDQRHFGGATGQFILERDLDAVAALLPKPPARVLDVPCGTGIYLAALTDNGYSMVGGDASQHMLDAAAERRTEAVLLPCDIYQLPFEADSFDATITLRLLSHFDQSALLPILQELGRVVHPGGRVIFDTFSWSPRHLPILKRVLHSDHIHPIRPTAVATLVAEAGLKVVDRRSLYLFSPLLQRKLPLGVVKVLAHLERCVPDGLLLRTFWSCTKR